MKTRLNLAVLALAVAATAVALPAQAQVTAAQRTEAGRHFRAGVDLFARGDFSAALADFQSAYRIAPHHLVRVNIANCYLRLSRPIDALNHFEHFLTEGAAAGPLDPQRRREVETQIAELRGQIAEVQVRIEPSSARDPIVMVDGQTANSQGVVRMMPGRHTVDVTADGFGPGHLELQVTAGQRSESVVALRAPVVAPVAAPVVAVGTPATGTPVVSTPVVATATPAAGTGGATVGTQGAAGAGGAPVGAGGAVEPPGTGGELGSGLVTGPVDSGRGLPPAAFIASAAGTGVLAIGWGVFGGLALSANGEFDTIARRVQSGTTTTSDRAMAESAASRARTFALVSDVMLGLTIGGAIATGIIGFNTRWRSAPPPAVLAMPWVSPHGAGLSIGGAL
ncbi:MAG: tetratricopeptide repeat protein [Deltaproteobacteria bacterium]|nr:tetratricopeptide repeat protein [Deltaproteobacteria bacterium]